MWEFYLSYCEGAFCARAKGVVQMLLAKPLHVPRSDAFG
jgi:cyclopropane fatty-acyl-phospholipid synthase-like methyltransferase